MSKRILLPLALSLAIITPVLAEDPPAPAAIDPVVKEAEAATARANAMKAQYEAQKAAAEARLAPLQQFAGDGTTHVESGGGQMEAAYLAAVTMADAARIIHGRIAPVTNPGDQGLPVLLLTSDEVLTFDAYSGFNMEANGIIRASVRILEHDESTCPVPGSTIRIGTFVLPAGAIATAGAIIGMLQSETHVYGFDQLGGDAMLVTAIAANANGRYIRQSALLSPAEPDTLDPVNVLMTQIGNCEDALRAKIAGMPRQTDEQKAAVAAIQAVLTRLTGFLDRMTTPAADGSMRLATALRQSRLSRSANDLVLRVQVNRAGGTMITVKNLGTALGLPAIRLSGGVIASYLLTDRTTGTVRLSGTVVCRTELTGLRSAIALRQSGLLCSANPPLPVSAQSEEDERRDRGARRLRYDPRVFSRLEPGS